MYSKKDAENKRRYYLLNKSKILIQRKKRRESNRSKVNLISLNSYRKNKEEISKRRAIRVKVVRVKVISHYSSGEFKCGCCGLNGIDFLTIDHDLNNGKDDRKKYGSGHSFYVHLIKKNFPANLSVKCMSCNISREDNGVCFHKGKTSLVLSSSWEELRNKVIGYYSKGKFVCACCGECERSVLQIDHPNNDGYAHRAKIGVSKLYQWLVNNNFPIGFEVLCASCNFSKFLGKGVCAHKRSVINLTSETSVGNKVD